MRQPLWVLNWALLTMFIFSTLANHLLRQEPPKLRPRIASTDDAATASKAAPVEQIYGHRDIFGLFSQPSSVAQKNSLVLPIPSFNAPTPQNAPALEAPKFLPPLGIGLNGIILSSRENESIAMIADESGKEKLHHFGDTIKDGTIIKIAQNRIVILRSNGQQETVFLRKIAVLPGAEEKPLIDTIVKKLKDTAYNIDLSRFPELVPSLGSFMEELSLSPEFDSGTMIGIKVGSIGVNSLGEKIGLQKDDIISTINNISLTSAQGRIQAYEAVKKSTDKNYVAAQITRDGQPLLITYKLGSIDNLDEDEQKAKIFSGGGTEENANTKEEKKEKFEKEHKNESYEDMISMMRQNLVGNMKSQARRRR
ncbi:hypothetical protein HOD08_03470 [bacterium]|nr:hypothetical protein [bacterium]